MTAAQHVGVPTQAGTAAILIGLRAAGEETRLRILALCVRAELTVSELVQILGQSQPGVSRHLRLLTEAGLVERFREGSWVFHRLATGGPGAVLARRLVTLFDADDPMLARDGAGLAQVQAARAARAADYFRRNAGRWNEVRSLHIDEAEVETAIARLGPDGLCEAMLDIGTGTGRMLEILGPSARRAVGVDLSPDMLAVARARLERAGLDHCTVRKADMYQLPFEDGSFDLVTIHHVLHFAADPARAVAEAARVLRRGGRLLVADFAPHEVEALRRDHEHRRLGFADEAVIEWAQAGGLEAEAVVHLPGRPLTTTIWLARRPAAAAEAGR